MTYVAQEETFPGTPEPLTPAQSALVPEKVQKLLGVFVDRGFAIKACILLPGLCLQHCWGSHVISKHAIFLLEIIITIIVIRIKTLLSQEASGTCVVPSMCLLPLPAAFPCCEWRYTCGS